VENKYGNSFCLILALWAAGLCAAAQFAKVSLIFPELMKLYPDAGPTAGFLVSLPSLLGVAIALTTGIIVARFGYRSLLLSGLILDAVISAHQATLPPFTLMLASRLLEGASHPIVAVVASTLIAHVSPDRYRAQAMTLWGTFFGVAFALVAWFGLPLARAQGLACLIAIHALAIALVAILLFLILPRGETCVQRYLGTHLTQHPAKAYRHLPVGLSGSTCYGMAFLYPEHCVSHHHAL